MLPILFEELEAYPNYSFIRGDIRRGDIRNQETVKQNMQEIEGINISAMDGVFVRPLKFICDDRGAPLGNIPQRRPFF